MKSILARAFLFAVGYILALSWSLNCIADEKVDLLIASLRARGSSLNGYSWSYQTSKLSGKPAYENGKGPSEDLVIAHRQKVSDLSRDPNFSAEGVVCLDARTGRYKIEHAGNGQWLGEGKVALNTYQVFSFDGDVYGSLQQAAPAASNPSEKGGLQQPVVVEFDSTTADNDSVNALMESCGINYLPNNLFTFGYEFGNLEIASPLLRLADLLETRSGIATFTASGPTDWNVTVALPGAEGRAIRYHFNPEENYSATRISLASILKDSVTTDDVFIYNKIYKARVWAPHWIERYNWINGIGSDIKLENFDISVVFSDEMFSLSVPTGAQVHDHIAGMSYIVSSGPVNEARAIAEYVGKHRLSVDNTHETSRWQLRTIGIAWAAVVFVSLVVARWRRKASGKAQTLVFCFCSLSIAGCGSKTDMTHGDPQRGVASVSASSVSWGE